MQCKIQQKDKGKLILPNGKESILFNKLLNIVGIENYDRALTLHNVTDTKEFKDYNKNVVNAYRAEKSVVKNARPTKGGFSEVFSADKNVRIVFKEGTHSVQLELIESYEKGKGLAKKFLQDFIYSFPNKDIELTISPRDNTTSFQGLATFYQSMGFDFKRGSSFEMERYKTKGRLYPEGYDINGEASVGHLMAFVNRQGKPKATKKDAIKMLQATGKTSSDDLLIALAKIEKEGIPIFTKENLQNTGIFSTFEISKILKSKKQQEGLVDMLKFLRLTDEIVIEEIPTENTGQVLESGKLEVKEATTDTTVNIINNSEVKPKKQRKANVATESTISFEQNPMLASNIGFVKRISASSWGAMQAQIGVLLEGIEEYALNSGINLKGLREYQGELGRDGVFAILDAVEDTLEENLDPKQLDATLNQLLGENTQTAHINIGEKEVVIETDLNEVEMFTQHNLVKVGENIYREANQDDYLTLLNTNAVLTERAIEEVENEVNKNYDRSLGNIEVAKQIYILKANMGIPSIKPIYSTHKVTTVNREKDFTQFEKEFAMWLVRNDNNLFKVDNNGISLVNESRPLEALESLPNELKQRLNDYAVQSTTLTLPEVFEKPSIESGLMSTERAKVMLDPYLLPPFEGAVTERQGEILVADAVDNFLRINDTVYEMTETVGNVSIYTPLTNTSIADLSRPKTATKLDLIEVLPLMTKASEATVKNNLTEAELNKLNEEHYKC